MNYQDTFKGTAKYYAKFRDGYPDVFFEYLKNKFSLNKESNVVDLGCGTGQLAIPISKFVNNVYAIDPEKEMLEEGKKSAVRHSLGSNIDWVLGDSSDLPNIKSTFPEINLFTIGSAFHWMDRKKVLKSISDIIHENGSLVVVGSSSVWNKKADWELLTKELIKKWLGQERRAGSSKYNAPIERHEDLIEKEFGNIEFYSHDYKKEKGIEDVIGYLYSTSFCSDAVLKEKKKPFEEELRKELLLLHPDGIFESNICVKAYIARKDK